MTTLSDAPGKDDPGESVTPLAASPALVPGESAYELKFTLDPAIAVEVERWAREHLTLDPHGDPARNDCYRIHGVYLDTPTFDVYHRSPWYGRRKYRLRRYGDESLIYLERKTKRAARVRKRRSAIPAAEAALLAMPQVTAEWAGEWFHCHVRDRDLRPTLAVRYDRLAFAGPADDSRLTLDRDLRCMPASGWEVPDADRGPDLLGGCAVLELKYHTTLPAAFRRLLQETGLCPSGMSKYRQGVQTLRLAGGGDEGVVG
jgi:hypothetical protein